MRPILAGRSSDQLRSFATAQGLDFRAFALDDPAAIDRELRGVDIVLNAAGPFGGTSRPLLDGCLRMGTAYTDIAGELDAYEAMFERQEEALRAGVAVVPGIGFDVVATDCLAVRGARELAGATSLDIAVGTNAGPSGGTMRATVSVAAQGGRARRDGVIVQESVGSRVLRVDLPVGDRGMVSAPLSDLVSAYETTGIPNIATYLVVPAGIRALAVAGARIGSWIAGIGPIRRVADALIRRFVTGPDEAARATGRTETWVRVTRGRDGIEYFLDAPDGYTYTMYSAVAAIERMLVERTPGILGPAAALGEEFIRVVPRSRLWTRRSGEKEWREEE
jgi:saccharopine dehydrogenase (NAD+, L-lysine-forming)